MEIFNFSYASKFNLYADYNHRLISYDNVKNNLTSTKIALQFCFCKHKFCYIFSGINTL